MLRRTAAARMVQGLAPMGFNREIPRLIQHIGSEKFASILLDAVRLELDCEQIIVFVNGSGAPPSTTFMVGRQPTHWHNQMYMSRYWRADPLLHRLQQDRSQELTVVPQSADEITDSDYRQDCYDRLGYALRLSLCQPGEAGQSRTNFYFARDRFQERGCTRFLKDSFPVMQALLARHGAYQARKNTRLTRRSAEMLIKNMGTDLTPRELQVAAGIACGLSSEGIALELGISINTVRTYRKRCYSSLNISSQNELLQLMIGDQACS
ncbi:helix-turn-helix transcriptional regulator [Pseudogemmobacter faecipullorum]|uniref:HTH luxR-type domain-containing protein n=1 Tax=Pseudogemmobacter faecipullorum TaxID=2755041 RepID=A0ABS8CJ52_9RHOB|nr:hypothetical protein [Pseudogemmobacter faecipullorum]